MAINKEEYLSALVAFQQVFCSKYPHTQASIFVQESYQAITKAEGVAFTGAVQQFADKITIHLFSEKIHLSQSERALLDKVLSFKQLGNNLVGLHL